MSEQTWHEARLIPTSGISGAPEQERRATSALLAVLSIVPDYSKRFSVLWERQAARWLRT
ncbi:hypothetical protein [Aeromicrobium sp. A1-2]|uniref:hypothetical protein n=1 Tax=Aeromicrobium sp. A1-2 TaxID=2107713 RepID=UPI001C1F20FF|nr:hypothetical protein [Aeromicrobium sp. A1-2]